MKIPSLLSALLLSATVSVVSASPARIIFARAIGDTCRAPQGRGSCQKTGNCKGISYPTGLCPRDPNDVQCCVEITCRADGKTGFCRSVSNNGCPGGSFHPGTSAPWPCPGGNDIQCCIKSNSGPLPPQPPSPPPDCKKKLSCTFAQIERMSMQERLDYVRKMQSDFFGPLKSGNQFRAIEGVIMFFMRKNLGQVGTWVSYVDAGIVEGIQRGGAIALGLGTSTGGNPGSEKWADFLRRKKAGQLDNRNEHDKAWSQAEQAATEYGKKLGDSKGLRVTPQLQLWYWSTQLFRLIMRQRQAAINALRIVLLWEADDFVNWLTDITQIEPTLCGAEAVWSITSPEVIAAMLRLPIGLGVLSDLNVIRAIKRIFQCFKDN